MGRQCHGGGCRWLAKLANIALLGLALFATQQLRSPQGVEILVLAILWLAPLINLAALCKGPDKEERDLQAQVRKAALRAQLKALNEGKGSCGCGNPSCSCGPTCSCQPGCTCSKCQPGGKGGCC